MFDFQLNPASRGFSYERLQRVYAIRVENGVYHQQFDGGPTTTCAYRGVIYDGEHTDRLN